MVAGATTAVMHGGRLDVVRVATDAFGNALGSAITDKAAADAAAAAAEQRRDQAAAAVRADQLSSPEGLKLVMPSFGQSTAGWTAPGLRLSLFGGEPPAQAAEDAQLGQSENATAGAAASTGDAASPAGPATISVGKEGGRGYWGVAESMLRASLGAKPSNADIQDLAQQLMSANPGVTVLKVGMELNPPDGTISREARATYAAMDQQYQADRQASLVDSMSPGEALGGGSQVGSLLGPMLFGAMPATVGSGVDLIPSDPVSELDNFAGDTRGGPPKVNREEVINDFRKLAKDLEVRQGGVKNAYDQAWAGMTNSSNGWGERLVYAGLALLAAPAAGMEEMGRGILNIPSAMANAVPLADQAGTELAIATDPSQPRDSRIVAGLGATRDLAFAFTGLGAPAALITPELNLASAGQTAEQRFLSQGFSPKQAAYLAQEYEGMGHHFFKRSWDLPDFITESPLSVLKPSGITRGDFYQLHFQVDPTFYGAAFPKSIGGSWAGSALGLEKYGFLGRAWYGSPMPLKLTLGGAAAAGAGTYYYYSNHNSNSTDTNKNH